MIEGKVQGALNVKDGGLFHLHMRVPEKPNAR